MLVAQLRDEKRHRLQAEEQSTRILFQQEKTISHLEQRLRAAEAARPARSQFGSGRSSPAVSVVNRPLHSPIATTPRAGAQNPDRESAAPSFRVAVQKQAVVESAASDSATPVAERSPPTTPASLRVRQSPPRRQSGGRGSPRRPAQPRRTTPTEPPPWGDPAGPTRRLSASSSSPGPTAENDSPRTKTAAGAASTDAVLSAFLTDMRKELESMNAAEAVRAQVLDGAFEVKQPQYSGPPAPRAGVVASLASLV
eukprot:TRINITY_DN11779_c0_g1_i1.p1 TRINITY_DN11779_c0_g1~~TRINITY_DN11779_c0_g1_i1.p1  ORF type:complete len:254 (+),score=81.49 TRINITY_DN11779_c0_g1_i1:552-1313(+)